jgi:hypothetical protein
MTARTEDTVRFRATVTAARSADRADFLADRGRIGRGPAGEIALGKTTPAEPAEER